MAEIDSLEIKITSEAGKAKKSIDSLSKSLETLSKKLKFDTTSLEKLSNINGTGIKNLGVGVKTLASGMKELQGIKKTDFNRLATGIERLAAIQTGNIEAVGNALSPLADGINILSNAKFDNKNLTNLVNSLTRLSNANTSSLANIDFASLGNSINGLAQTLSKAEEVKQNTISMTNAVAKLANAGAGAGEAASALPGLGQNLGEFMNKISRAKSVETDTITFTQAVGTLANAGKKTETTANSLKKLGDELLKFFQTMSGAPNVSQNTIQMTQALSQLANAGGRTGSAVRGLGNVFTSSGISANTFNSGINKLSKSMNGLNGSIGKALGGIKNFSRSVLSAMGVTLGLYGTVRGAMKAMDISSDLTEVQNVVDATFGDMAYKVEDFAKTSIEQFGMSELSLKQYASRFQSMGAAMGINSGLINDANKFLNEQTEGYIGLSDSMSDVSLNMTKLTADMASLYNVEQKDVAKDLEAIFTGMTVPLRTYGLDLTQATLAEWAMKNGLDADIKSMSQAEKTMLRYQYVMANTTAAHNDFARTADTWANQTRIMRQNFEQLAAVIGGVLVNSFKPVVKVINAAMSHIIAFAKTISNALGQIFGWTYEEGGGGLAQDFGGAAEGAEDVADSTGTAAKNIDKMKKGIRAFDELKTIDFPEPSGETGGNGAGGAEGGAAAGEGLGGKWNPGESIIKKFTSDIDSLYKLGEYIGDALTKAMESIPWDSVYKKARNFGSGLAQFLNGLISPELFSALGKTIAGALNTALHFLDSFGETFDFENFGISIGAGINAALEGIDWETALSAAKKWGTGIGNAINGFFQETDFSLVGSTLANALNTAIQFALNLGTTLDFEQIGLSISDGINGFFETFDFVGLAESINVWIKGGLTTVTTLLQETDFEQIGQKIGTFLAELDFLEIAGKLATALWEAIKAGFELLGGLIQEAPLETALIAVFGFFKFTGIGKLISGNIATSLSTSLATALGGLSLPSLPILAAIAGVAAVLVDLWNTSETFRDSVGLAFSMVKDSLVGAFEKIRNSVTPLWEKIKELGQAIYDFYEGSGIKKVVEILASLATIVAGIVASAVFTVLGNMISGFATMVGGVIDTLTGIFDILTGIFTLDTEKIGEGFSKILEGIGGIFGGFLKQFGIDTKEIGKFFSSAWESAKKVWEKVSNWFNKYVIDPVKKVFDGLKTKISNAFSTAWNLVKGVWNAVSGWFKTNVGDKVVAVFEKKDGVSSKIKGAFEDAYDGITGVFGAIGDFFKGIANGIIKPIGDAINGIIKGINWVLDKVGAGKPLELWTVPQFAKGDRGLPQDTIGIVNDQKGNVYKELIVPPHGKPFIPEGRNVMLPMEKGTKIMPARQTKDLMQKMNGMPCFAGGIGDFFAGAWSKITEFTGNVWDYLTHPEKILQIAFDKFTDLSGMLEPVLSIAKGAASTLLDGATGFIKKIFDENLTVQYNPSKGVEQWRGLATKALQMTGHFSALNLELMMKQIQTESSGNPRAINLWDANAKRGTPSKGILQVIDSTFRAFALAPYNKDIWDPLSNMLAAIRYVVSKSGGIAGNWGKNKGYASGIGKINIADLIPQYRNGGFPEDGLFYANHNEVIGRFSNGQTAVANNGQITQGIAEAIYPAVYNAVSSAMRNNGAAGSGDISLQLNLDGDAVYKNVVKRTREGRNRNIGGRLVLAEEVY